MTPATSLRLTLWLRRTHGWFGLWGATLGLLFGFSGIWLNHRAVLKLPLAVERHESQIALPEPPPATPEALAAWLRTNVPLDGPMNAVRVEKARPVPWAEAAPSPAGSAASSPGGKRLMQPEHWTLTFGGPQAQVQAETWAGNRSVSLRRTDNGVVATLTNLHKGIGMPLPWILLVDTLAGSLIFLSLSGVLLWWQTHRRSKAGLLIFAAGAAAVAGLAASRL